ncbi:MAG TPA: hypothetical protein VGF44_10000 [Terriglobales bacterium]|jgi:hypothetical protein
MKFARIIYAIAAIYGIFVLTPLYFLINRVNIDTPPAVTHPEFYYGFAGIALLWQFVFIFIARDPVRYRPIMVLTFLAKIVYTLPVMILYTRGEVHASTLHLSLVDPVFGILFVAAYLKTPRRVSA